MPHKFDKNNKLPLSLLLAKPSGILLKDHVLHVWEEAKVILDAFPFLQTKYKAMTGLELKDSLKKAVQFHDVGKEDPRWQKACQLDFLQYKEWCKENKVSHPDKPESFQRYEAERRKGKEPSSSNLQKANFRHEFASLAMTEDRDLPLEVRLAIAAHHGKLSKKHQHRWLTDGEGDFKGIWSNLISDDRVARSNRNTPEVNWQNCLKRRFAAAAIRSLLQLADTRASRKESGKELPQLKSFEYDFPYKQANGELNLRPVQKAALACADNQISILRAPTGSGKTDAALLWAKKQILSLKRADRMVVAMPTRFTSNALALNIQENVSNTGLYHSSAWYTRYGSQLSFPEKDKAREEHKLSQLLGTPVTVCTVDHLLMCLTGTKEIHHSTFYFLSNACVVLDEADFYDSFIQANLQVLLEALRQLNVPVLIMSATVPDSARQLYAINEPIQEAEQEEEPKRQLAFIGTVHVDTTEEEFEMEVEETNTLQFSQRLREIFDGILQREQGIVFANTVERGLAFYEYFRTALQDKSVPLIFYHSRFTEPDKKAIEERLLAALGRKAWESHCAKGIAILTQIGEMSINISAPIMYSDACPWDRLAQRLGRLNRFGEGEFGAAYVGEPWKKGMVYPAPYGNYVHRQGWEETPPFRNTLDALRKHYFAVKKPITAQDLVRSVNELYATPENLTTHAQSNQKTLKEWMQLNWMINPATKVEEEYGEAGDWRSRNIEPQDFIYSNAPNDEQEMWEVNKKAFPFASFDAFRSYQLENGISCPIYLLEKGKKTGEVIPFAITIGDELKPQIIYQATNYNREIGLASLGTTVKAGTINGGAANIL